MSAAPQNPVLLNRPLSVLACVTLLFSGGCFHPGMYGRPYGYPMYAPPQSINPGGPGTLIIPESNTAPYAPGSKTYDDDPDDFRQSDDEKFFNPDDKVPLPNGRKSPFFQEDDLGPSTSIQSGENIHATVARPVSRTVRAALPVEYGFDTKDYRWLRGVLRQSADGNFWSVNYSEDAGDSYSGKLDLSVTRGQIGDLNDGDPVIVHGHIEPNVRTVENKAVYYVETIRPISTRLAL